VGGLSGFLGVHLAHGTVQLRVQDHVTHLIAMRHTVLAEIFYDGPAPPPSQARAFFIPFAQDDGSQKYLVILFEVGLIQPPQGDL
jgi:hypothetical protein